MLSFQSHGFLRLSVEYVTCISGSLIGTRRHSKCAGCASSSCSWFLMGVLKSGGRGRSTLHRSSLAGSGSRPRWINSRVDGVPWSHCNDIKPQIVTQRDKTRLSGTGEPLYPGHSIGDHLTFKISIIHHSFEWSPSKWLKLIKCKYILEFRLGHITKSSHSSAFYVQYDAVNFLTRTLLHSQ